MIQTQWALFHIAKPLDTTFGVVPHPRRVHHTGVQPRIGLAHHNILVPHIAEVSHSRLVPPFAVASHNRVLPNIEVVPRSGIVHLSGCTIYYVNYMY